MNPQTAPASRTLHAIAGGAAQPELRIYFLGGLFGRTAAGFQRPEDGVFMLVGPTNGLPYVACRGLPRDTDEPAILFELAHHHSHLYQVDLEAGTAVLARRSIEADLRAPAPAPQSVRLDDGHLAMLREAWRRKSAELGLTAWVEEDEKVVNLRRRPGH